MLVAFTHKTGLFKQLLLPTEPFIYDENSDTSSFLNEVVSIVEKEGKIDWIRQTGAEAMFMDVPKNSLFIPFGNYVLDLSKSQDDLWPGIHSKHRNVIRRAEKSGVIVKSGGTELLDDYIYADNMTMRRSNLPLVSKEYYLQYIDKYRGYVNVFGAYMDGEIQSGAIILYNSSIGYYIYGATIDDAVLGSSNLLQWEIIKFLREKGVKRYSFVGARINEDQNSKYHGIQRFKERFGGTLIQGYMFKYIFHKNKYRLYSSLKKIRNHGQDELDIIDQEIKKWQNVMEQ